MHFLPHQTFFRLCSAPTHQAIVSQTLKQLVLCKTILNTISFSQRLCRPPFQRTTITKHLQNPQHIIVRREQITPLLPTRSELHYFSQALISATEQGHILRVQVVFEKWNRRHKHRAIFSSNFYFLSFFIFSVPIFSSDMNGISSETYLLQYLKPDFATLFTDPNYTGDIFCRYLFVI